MSSSRKSGSWLLGMIAMAMLGLTCLPIATAEVVTNEVVPIAAVVSDPCTGEDVFVEGNAHLLERTTADGNGGIRVGVHINTSRTTGTGSSGAKYQLSLVQNVEANLNHGASEITIIIRTKLVAQRGHNDLDVDVHLHITVDARGNLRSSLDVQGATCQ